ncbi:MAG: CBS domain-containing protein [Polyangiaceae bacterium]
MRIEDLMTHTVHTCFEDDTLEQAAHAMWDWDIGCLVVIDSRRCPVGMITDRDIAMAAYTQGVPLRNARVRSAMASNVVTCYPGTKLCEVEAKMQEAQIRRIPVIDPCGILIGIVTLADIAHFAQLSRIPLSESPGVTNTLGNITRRRGTQIRDGAGRVPVGTA